MFEMRINFLGGVTLLSLLLFYGPPGGSYAQTGPAGIGNSDGSGGQPRNVLWLRADTGVSESSGKISTWSDQSGNGLDASQGTAGLQPNFNSNVAGLNNLPALVYPAQNGTDNIHLSIPHSSLLNDAEGMSFFAVVLPTASTNQYRALINKRLNSGSGLDYRFFLNNSNFQSNIGSGGTFSIAFTADNPQIFSTVFDGNLTGNRYFGYRNSNATSAATTGPDAVPSNTHPFFIGAFDVSGGETRHFEGNIAEIIVYRNTLNAAQRIIVENYLSEKYAISIGTNDGFGTTAGYDAAYFEDFRGIGTVDGVDKVTDAASDALELREFNNTLDAGEWVMYAHDGTAHSEVITELGEPEISSRWAREWHIEVSKDGTADDGSVSVDLVFDFDAAALSFSGNVTDYVLLFRSDTGEDFVRKYAQGYTLEGTDKVVVTVPGNRFKSGYYTLGMGSQIISNTWYVFQDGDWDQPATWTLDASTAPIFNNPGNNIPGPEDQVIIRSGKAVTIPDGLDNLVVSSVEIRGTLDLTTSTGHNFNIINGNGLVRMAGHDAGSGLIDNFPEGNTGGSIGFSDGDNGGTLIVYGGGNLTLDAARTLNHLRIDRTTETDLVVLAADITLNGNLTVRHGRLQFGDGTATARTLFVRGNTLVENNGTSRVGSIRTASVAGAVHTFEMLGNFTNNGQSFFTNRSDFASTADRYNTGHAYYSSDDNTGRVNVLFTADDRDQVLDCNNLTYFSRIVIDKGTDATYALMMQATDSSHFRLLGRASYNIDSDITTPGANLNALALIKGTVKLDNNLIVPVLNTGTNYSVPSAARFWIDGGYLRKTVGAAIVPYGIVEISEGNLICDAGSGVTLRGSGALKVDGGTVRLKAFRTSIQGASAQGTYEQNGGYVTVTGGAGINDSYAVFSLTYPGNVFIMSGGTLLVQGRPNLGTGNLRGSVFINCDPGNQNVTGGTVIFDSNTTTEYRITSRTPFYDVVVRKSVAGSTDVVLMGTTSGTGGGVNEPSLDGQPLVALRDLEIEKTNNARLVAVSATHNQDVYIGRNFTLPYPRNIGSHSISTSYISYVNASTYNTTFFNGSEEGVLYIGDSTGEYRFGNLYLDKPHGTALRLDSQADRSNANLTFRTEGECRVESGTLDQGRLAIRMYGPVVNKDRLGTWYTDGPYPTATGTPNNAQVRFREDAGGITIQTTSDAVFGYIRFNALPTSPIIATSDFHIERLQYLRGRIYLGSHRLTIDDIESLQNNEYFDIDGNGTNNNDYDCVDFANNGREPNTNSNEKLFYTSGLSSDGGLSLLVTRNTSNVSVGPNQGPVTFPIGYTTNPSDPLDFAAIMHRPAQMRVNNFVDSGYVTIRPVAGVLATTNAGGPGSANVLGMYWRVSHEGFGTLPTVGFRFFYRDDDVQGTETTYVPGKVLDGMPFTRSSETAVNMTFDAEIDNTCPNTIGNRITFNGATGGNVFTQSGFGGFELEAANYTAGHPDRFSGAPLIYYTRGMDDTGSQPLWTTASTWTRSDLPGFDSSNPHRSSNPAASTVPGAGDIVYIGFFPWDDPKTTYRGYPHSARVNSGNLNCANLYFTQMADNLGNRPAPRRVMSELGGTNHFLFRPTLTWNSTGSISVNIISGEGTIRIRGEGTDGNRRDPSFASVDLGGFSAMDSSFLLYETFNSYTINNIPDVVPNLMITTDSWGSNDHTATIAKDFTTNQNLEILGNSNLMLGNGAGGNPTVKGNLHLLPLTSNVGGGELRLQNSGNPRTISVEGDVIIGRITGAAATGGSVIRVVDGGAASLEHTLIVGGNIVINTAGNNTSIAPNGNGLILGDDPSAAFIALELNGTTPGSFTVINGNLPQIYSLALNKGTSPAPTFTVQCNMSIGGPTNAADKAIEILNGTLILDHPDIDVTLSSGGGHFYLPNSTDPRSSSGSGGLEIRQGMVRISGSNTGMILDGLLRISGGTLNMDDTVNNGNNFIEYSASGNAVIELSDGALVVGSQLRRSTTSAAGVLKYRQTGGTAVLGKNAAPTTSRGIFEVLNPGSEFNLEGGDFTIVRHVNSATVPTLRLSPAAHNITAPILLGNGDTPAAQNNLGVFSEVRLDELWVASANITARIYSVPLAVNTLNIGIGCAFDANGYNLNVLSQLNNDGSFVSSGNTLNNQTTVFPAAGASSITGTGTTLFWNFGKSGTGTLSLYKNITVNNNAELAGGTLDTRDQAFNLKKDLKHDALHTSDLAGPGIVFNGMQKQKLDRTGPGTSHFGVVKLNNASGLIIEDTEENFQINHKLILETGIFDIGGNLLIFPPSAGIENGSGGSGKDDFNAYRMIQTNSSIRDFGVRKYYNAVSGGNVSFTYPVGLTTYTPVVATVNDISASYITARPVSDIPPIVEDDETTVSCTDPNIVDADNVLQYYWIMKSSGVSGFAGKLEMYYDASDFRVTAPHTVANYGPARLYNADDQWDKVFTEDQFDELNRRIEFPFTGNSDATINGIYTAGVTLRDDGTLLCGAAIPDQVPFFETYATTATGGFYFDGSYQGGAAPLVGSTPDIIVRSGYTLVMDQNSIRTRKITIESGATLEVGDGTAGHNLGFITGEGTLKLSANGTSVSFPSGDYEEFFPDENCIGGGGLEYAGTGNYTVLAGMPSIRRVIFSGSGDRAMPNNHTLRVCENLELRGSIHLAIPDGNNSITVGGNVYKSDASSFDNGGGNSTITMQGSALQLISGEFTGFNAFNRLRVNNAAGLTIVNAADAGRGISANGNIDVDDQLIFASGRIVTNANNDLRLRQGAIAVGYSDSRYVNGPLIRELPPNTQPYVFPVGDGNRYGLMEIIDPAGFSGSKNFTVRYFNGASSYDRTLFSANADSQGLEGVSGNEHWNIDAASPANSQIKLYWDAYSNVDGDFENELVMVFWDGSAWDILPTVTGPSGTTTSGFLSSGPMGYSSHDVTFGTLDASSNPLPVTLLYFKGWNEGFVNELEWKTASEKNNDRFELERSADGDHFEVIGVVAGNGTTDKPVIYRWTDNNPLKGNNYYRFRQVDFDGAFEYSEIIRVKNESDDKALALIVPNPSRQRDEVYIALRGTATGTAVQVHIGDMQGRLIRSYSSEIESDGRIIVPTEISDLLSRGLYAVTIIYPEGRLSVKWVVR